MSNVWSIWDIVKDETDIHQDQSFLKLVYKPIYIVTTTEGSHWCMLLSSCLSCIVLNAPAYGISIVACTVYRFIKILIQMDGIEISQATDPCTSPFNAHHSSLPYSMVLYYCLHGTNFMLTMHEAVLQSMSGQVVIKV